MIPAYFITVDRSRLVVNVEFAFRARLIECHLMFDEVLAAARREGIFAVFIDCRSGVRAPLPIELNCYEKIVRANARKAAGVRIAILIRLNDPITDRVASMVHDRWAQAEIFRDEQAARDWLARPRPPRALLSRLSI